MYSPREENDVDLGALLASATETHFPLGIVNLKLTPMSGA